MNLSPATIRNIMSDLDDLGLVASPHTSAGRIPTIQGYRLFVDSLLTVKPLRKNVISRLQQELDTSASSPATLIESASSMLSSFTRMAGVVTVPRRNQLVLRQIEFLPLSGNRVLVILVTNEHEVHNRIIHTARSYTAAELERTANYLNREYLGMDMDTIRLAVMESMEKARDDMSQIMQTALDVADRVFSSSDAEKDEDYVLAGQNNLMGYQEMSDVEKLRQLFEVFNTKRDLLHLLDSSINAEGVQIYIGDESGYAVLDNCSVVAAPYKISDSVVGVLGVIGPTRMAYDKVISIVDVTAKLVGSALSSK